MLTTKMRIKNTINEIMQSNETNLVDCRQIIFILFSFFLSLLTEKNWKFFSIASVYEDVK